MHGVFKPQMDLNLSCSKLATKIKIAERLQSILETLKLLAIGYNGNASVKSALTCMVFDIVRSLAHVRQTDLKQARPTRYIKQSCKAAKYTQMSRDQDIYQ